MSRVVRIGDLAWRSGAKRSGAAISLEHQSERLQVPGAAFCTARIVSEAGKHIL